MLLFFNILIINYVNGLQGNVSVKGDNVVCISKCYEELGCFSTSGPFFDLLYRPLNLLPESREKINTQFILYTRLNSARGQKLSANDELSIKNSNFNGSNPTVFIIHGFLDSGFKEWINNMISAFLIKDNYNAIAVDWSGGSRTLYTQATANTRLVGAEIALLINYLIKQFQLNSVNCHLVGHSLGSHIAGYAGERIIELGRITGLDPAEPYFQNTDPVVRLDPNDANFVDIIHTDIKSILALGFGMSQPIGHLDFYPNGGTDQPGCEKDNTVTEIITTGLGSGVYHFVACNHLRSYLFFTDTIHHPDDFVGIKCSSYEDLKAGNCNECGVNGQNCLVMGIKAKPSGSKKFIKLYLTTRESSPYSVYSYNIEISLETHTNAKNMQGHLYLTFEGQYGNVDQFKLTDSTLKLVHGNSYRFFSSTTSIIGDIQKIRFYWEYDYSILNPITWPLWKYLNLYINQINILDFQKNKRYFFCGNNTPVKSKESKTFKAQTSC